MKNREKKDHFGNFNFSKCSLLCVYFEANDSHALWMKGEEKGQNVYSGSTECSRVYVASEENFPISGS